MGYLRGQASHGREFLGLEQLFLRLSQPALHLYPFIEVNENTHAGHFLSLFIVNKGCGKIAFDNLPILSHIDHGIRPELALTSVFRTSHHFHHFLSLGHPIGIYLFDFHFIDHILGLVPERLLSGAVPYDDVTLQVCGHDSIRRTLNDIV